MIPALVTAAAVAEPSATRTASAIRSCGDQWESRRVQRALERLTDAGLLEHRAEHAASAGDQHDQANRLE